MSIRKIGILALALGCMTVLSGCTNSYIKETEDALDPLGYAAAGYYGKTREELKELLPELEEGGGPDMNMVQESAISETINCKQVFCFYDNKVVEIQYIYQFKVGEEAEEKFIEQCQRIAEIDKNAFGGMLACKRPVGEIREGFWDELLASSLVYTKEMVYMTICNSENTQNVNREAASEGWKKEYNILVSGVFAHKSIDWETGERKESGVTLPHGSDAQIFLTIATWD